MPISARMPEDRDETERTVEREQRGDDADQAER
jgi:hypothetical protein